MIYLVRILAIGILLSVSSLGYAGDCAIASNVCVDASPTKMISGVPVPVSAVGGCWQYDKTYTCSAGVGINYCAPLVSAGCTATSSVCAAYGLGGACSVNRKTYRCGDSIGTPTNTVVLASTYTLVQDTIDRSACASLDANASCAKAGSICLEGPETRVIGGLPVYKDCWRNEDQFTCSAGTFANYCAPLTAMGCAETTNVCKVTASWDSGVCLEYERTFNCNEKPDPVPPNVTYLNSSYTIVDDTTVSTCTASEGDPNCTQSSSVCTEGPETRVINGLPVYKDCWKTEKEFVCASTVLTDDCGDLKARPECLETTAPKCVDTLPGGQCGLLEHTYECSIGAEKTKTVTDCETQSFCLDGTCFDTGYTPDNDFGKTVASMEALREASVNGLFKGTADGCASSRAFGLKNCCKNSSGAASSSNSQVASTIGTTALKIGYEEIKVLGSPYVYDALYNSGIKIFEEYALEAMCSAPVGGFSVWGAEFAVGMDGAISFVGFDPWSLAFTVALKIITDMMACDEADQITSMKRGQGLCHHVGSYCESKFLGACKTKRESYCCFTSKLGKLVQEQGRPQIGKSWGSETTPDCSGFTLEELTSLDFSAMDFSEFITDIAPPGKDASFAIQRLTDKASSYYATP